MLHQQLEAKEQQLKEKDEVRDCLVERETQKGEAKAERIGHQLRAIEEETEGLKNELERAKREAIEAKEVMERYREELSEEKGRK